MSEIPGPPSRSRVDHVDALPVGSRLGEFEIVGLLGVGGFGMVYQAFDHSLLRFVAIKEYMPTALAGRTEGVTIWVRSSADEPSFKAGLASFVEEARLLAQFDHTSLVKVFRFWESNRTAYMVMPLYTGMTLKEARRHMRTPPPEAWLRKVIWSACSALRVLHEGRTLHRDISPDNIFLQDSGPPVLLDLGAARFAIGDTDHKHTAVLKVNYAPIEQYADSDSELKPGPWSDIYSLAAVIYGCVCNDVPLPSTLRSIRDRMVPFSRVARTVRSQFGVEYSSSFVDTITKALSLQPRDRHWTVDAFLQQLGMSSAPPGLEKFDFRAELGDVWVEPQVQEAVAAVQLDLSDASVPLESVKAHAQAPLPEPPASTLAMTLPPTAAVTAALSASMEAKTAAAQAAHAPETEFQETLVRGADFEDTLNLPPETVQETGRAKHAASSSGAHNQRPRHDKRPSRPGAPRIATPVSASRKARQVLLASAAMVTLVVAAAAWHFSTTSAPAPQEGGQDRPFVRTPDEDILTELAEPAPDEAALAQAAAEASSAAAAADAAAAGAVASAASAHAAFTVAKDQRPRLSQPVRKPSEMVEVAEAVDAPQQPVAPVSSRPAPAPDAPRPASPEEACADASFLGKPMCIHNQCQQPAMQNHPVCVENKRKRDEERRQRLMYSQ